MPESLISLLPIPGIQRDGTTLDSTSYTDGQWVRFQRKIPKKMGGYFKIAGKLQGPVNMAHIFSEDGIHYINIFGQKGIEAVGVDDNGLGGAVINRTPSPFTEVEGSKWSVDTMFDAAAGSQQSIILACQVHPDSSTEYPVYWALATDLSQFTAITDGNAVAAGGVFSAPPYAVLYGKDGKVVWSNQNEPQNYTTGDATTARPTGSKIVQGFPMRSGGGMGGLLWSLDSVIRMDYIGGQAVFRFQKLSQSSSILTQNTIVEYDGMFYWIGSDRFLYSDGSTVKELPNNTNFNWFFDNLNFNAKHKVWGTKIPRYGEIWWYFPFGDNEVCTHAIVFNVRENCWYDVVLPRAAGYHSQNLPFPVSIGSEADNLYKVTLSGVTGSFTEEDTVVSASGATFFIKNVVGTDYYMSSLDGELVVGDTLTNLSITGSATVATIAPTYSLYGHERGLNAVVDENTLAIESYFTTMDFGMPTGGLDVNAREGVNNWTRLTRIEPDFVQNGPLTIQVVSKEYANSPEVFSEPEVFTSSTEKIDLRIQARHLRLKITSNVKDGFYEMGRTLIHTEPGDNRA